MGFTPIQVDQCSFWQFNLAQDGYRKANDPEAAMEPPSNVDFDDMLAKYEKHSGQSVH